MTIYVVGLNYKTASLGLREKIYFAPEKQALYLQDLLTRGLAHEAVLLSTCNRSEIYCDAEDVGVVADWFCAQAGESQQEVAEAVYCHQGEQAVSHIMQVACGIDSMVLGEPQILGQVKDAFSEGCSAGAVGSLLHRLFQEVFSVAKDIRTATSVGACPVSVASAALHFAKEQKPDFTQSRVALIGAGDTVEILLRYLVPQLEKPIMLVNRSLDKASDLTDNMNVYVHGLDQLTSVLARADIVLTATGSAVPIITKEIMQAVQQQREDANQLMIDIAVPRDIDPAVAELDKVSLYCIDDLKAIIEKNRQGREHAAYQAKEMILEKSRDFIARLGSYDNVSHAIRSYRGQIEEICQAELLKAKRQLMQGGDPAEVLDSFAYAFTQKLLHVPSVQLRQAGEEGRFELLKFARQLFAIPDPEIESA